MVSGREEWGRSATCVPGIILGAETTSGKHMRIASDEHGTWELGGGMQSFGQRSWENNMVLTARYL